MENKNWLDRLEEQFTIQKNYKPNGDATIPVELKLTPENAKLARLMLMYGDVTLEALVNRLIGNSINYVNGTYPVRDKTTK